MPIYEYRCNNCRRLVSVFVRSYGEKSEPVCEHCQSKDLTRLFSRFALGKGDWYKRKGVYEDILSDQRLIRRMEANDPRALAEWNRRMSMGSEEGIAPEYSEPLERMERGEPLEQVMKSFEGQEAGEG